MQNQNQKLTEAQEQNFVKLIKSAESAAYISNFMWLEQERLVREYGKEAAMKLIEERSEEKLAMSKLAHAEAIARWEERRKSGKPLPLDPPAPNWEANNAIMRAMNNCIEIFQSRLDECDCGLTVEDPKPCNQCEDGLEIVKSFTAFIAEHKQVSNLAEHKQVPKNLPHLN